MIIKKVTTNTTYIYELILYFGRGLLVLLLVVFPANIHMAVDTVFIEPFGEQNPIWLWVRLPFQIIIATQVWYAGLYRIIDE
jgi:uncharacterized membrane protein